MMALSSVVLPAPLEPITVTSAPVATAIETSCTTSSAPVGHAEIPDIEQRRGHDTPPR